MQWNKVSMKLIKQCCTGRTQGISRTLQTWTPWLRTTNSSPVRWERAERIKEAVCPGERPLLYKDNSSYASLELLFAPCRVRGWGLIWWVIWKEQLDMKGSIFFQCSWLPWVSCRSLSRIARVLGDTVMAARGYLFFSIVIETVCIRLVKVRLANGHTSQLTWQLTVTTSLSSIQPVGCEQT